MEEFEHTIRDTPEGGHPSADEEYDAGYAARFHDEADCGSATASWRAGWSDADRDLAKAEEEGTPAQAPLRFFGSGSLARRCGLPFDPFSSEEWKREWVEADIALDSTSPIPGHDGPARRSEQGRGDGEAMESPER